jgi:hypothetical protein
MTIEGNHLHQEYTQPQMLQTDRNILSNQTIKTTLMVVECHHIQSIKQEIKALQSTKAMMIPQVQMQ